MLDQKVKLLSRLIDELNAIPEVDKKEDQPDLGGSEPEAKKPGLEVEIMSMDKPKHDEKADEEAKEEMDEDSHGRSGDLEDDDVLDPKKRFMKLMGG